MSEKKEGCRPVKINIAMEETSPLRLVIEQLFKVEGDPKSHYFMNNMSEADFVISDDIRKIEKDYSDSKAYALLDVNGYRPESLPTNVTDVISTDNAVVEILNLIHKIWLTLKPLEAPKPEIIIPEVTLRHDALRILVIEDTPKHQTSAKVGFAGHKLTVVTGYEKAMQILGNEKFDVVLTDLLMPMSSRTLGNAFKLGELVPYGLLLKDEAAHQGAKFVAVVTDTGHHDHWVSAAFDHFRYPLQIEGAKVLMMHAPMKRDESGELVKDWAEALDRLMKA